MSNSKSIELRVLKLLLISESYNQNTIAGLIGLDPDKSTSRVQVSRALKKLNERGYLERKRNELDELGIKWTLKKDIEIIQLILEKYPEMLQMLHNNFIIRDLVYQKHVNLISEFYQHMGRSSDTKAVLKFHYSHMLSLSPTFFKNFLLNDSSTLDQVFSDLYNKTQKYIITDESLKHPIILETCFRACVISDRVNGYIEPSGDDIEKIFEPPFL